MLVIVAIVSLAVAIWFLVISSTMVMMVTVVVASCGFKLKGAASRSVWTVKTIAASSFAIRTTETLSLSLFNFQSKIIGTCNVSGRRSSIDIRTFVDGAIGQAHLAQG